MKYKKSEIQKIIQEEYTKLLKEGLISETYGQAPKRPGPLVEAPIYRQDYGLYGNRIQSARRGNQLPPKDSNWYAFAKAMDIGVLDLDEIAVDMGFSHFDHLDGAISPRSMYGRDLRKLETAMLEINGATPKEVQAAAQLPYTG